RGVGRGTQVTTVPIPLDCTDGFNDAYYGRPEMLLDPAARLACSAWSFVEPAAVARFEASLARALAAGTWDARHGTCASVNTWKVHSCWLFRHLKIDAFEGI